ncbi:MAG: ferritin-like domain-containing protein [Candidatus Polarisedimenticolia bacterium]
MSLHLWLTYFALNAAAPRGIPWELGPDLPPEEARRIVPSLREFQRGETSNGRHLRAIARAWAARHGETSLVQALELFIVEEQRHAAELERFLVLNGHLAGGSSVNDAAFRALRRVSVSLEGALSVLLTAEIIGFVYYGALRHQTRSPLLRALCRTFQHDEAAHLLFHAELLGGVRRGRPGLLMRLTEGLSWMLLMASCAAAWRRHRMVLRFTGLSFSGFASRCTARLRLARQPRSRSHGGSPGISPAGPETILP